MFETECGSGPSPALVAALEGVDPARLPDGDLVDLITACQQVISWASAVQARGVGALARRQLTPLPADHPTGISSPAVGGVGEHAVDELAAALRYSSRQASRLLTLGIGLARLPGTAAALHDGIIDVTHARVLAEDTADLPDQLARQVEAAVLEAAGRCTPGQLAGRIARTITRLAPDHVHTQHETARADRRVGVYADPRTGTGGLTATGLDPIDTQAIWARLTSLAHAVDGTGDPRTLDARRVDALVALLAGTSWPAPAGTPTATAPDGLVSSGGPTAPGGPTGGNGPTGPSEPTVVVHLALTADTLTGDEPAWLAGYGPLTAHQARRVLTTRHTHPVLWVLDPATRTPTATSPPSCPDHTCQPTPTDHEQDDPSDDDPPDGALPGEGDDPPRGGPPTSGGPGTPTSSGPGAPAPPPLLQDGSPRGDPRVNPGAPTPPAGGYRPGRALTRLIRARDQVCRFPTCRANATHADLDHLTAWPAGPTSKINLWALCRHHHLLKHSGNWRVLPLTPAGTDGPVAWTSPTGHTYLSLPERQ